MHNAEIVEYYHKADEGLQLYRGQCSCGEKSPGFNTQEKAEEWKADHLAKAGK